MKNKLRSYERPFKMKKDGVFLFLISFLVPEIQCFHDFVLSKLDN